MRLARGATAARRATAMAERCKNMAAAIGWVGEERFVTSGLGEERGICRWPDLMV